MFCHAAAGELREVMYSGRNLAVRMILDFNIIELRIGLVGTRIRLIGTRIGLVGSKIGLVKVR